MKYIFNIIKNNVLFEGITLSDFEKIFFCLSAKKKSYKKNEVILISGNIVNHIFIILSGSVQIVKENIDGKENILTELYSPEIFGEVFACANIVHSPITAIASDKSEVLFINYKKIITSCPSSCISHTKLIGNMLKLIAKKNLMLLQKIELLSKRTTRDRLLLYFDMQRGMAKKFTIPYNREDLAAYLCVDRSAMSNEFSKMQKDGIIKYKKNIFEVL